MIKILSTELPAVSPITKKRCVRGVKMNIWDLPTQLPAFR